MFGGKEPLPKRFLRRGIPSADPRHKAAGLGAETPNVKDEPRRELARRVRHHDPPFVVSLRNSLGRTRRDRSRRWLWRLVRPIFQRLKCAHLSIELSLEGAPASMDIRSAE